MTLTLTFLGNTAAAPGAAAPIPTPAALVDALNNTFGRHEGKRASHAKGFCAAGEFTPSPDAARIVHSPLFAQGPLPATLRFSVGGGNPNVSDKSRTVRGLAIRLGAGAENYDLVLVSEPVFFAATPASFVSFLQARVADPATGKPDPARIAAHNAAYPDGTRQPALLAAHPAPASYATSPYFSNNAFIFENAAKKRQHARIVVEPAAGIRYLTDDEEKTLPDSFLQAELAARAQRGAVDFTVYAQLPASGDSLTDGSTPWAGAGKVALGRLRVTQAGAGNGCDSLVFMPVTLPAGITASDDPILQSRAAAYAVSLSRRAK